MKIDLVQYLKERYLAINGSSQDPGPVVTIAREAGCPGRKVAQKLSDALNQLYLKEKKSEVWKWVGKEIFDEAAKELDLEPEEVQRVFKEKRNIIDEILSSQTQKFYKSDRRVRKTIGQVIRSMANDGHAIILGRGGVAITKDIPSSIHIFLEAPLEWRAAIISEKQCCSHSEAIKYAEEIDKRRAQYRDYFEGKGTDYTWFDVRFNCMTLDADEIVAAIVKLMELKKII
jgi:cytidylate kinase